jgi:P27 family predicted phage terminase small subunit
LKGRKRTPDVTKKIIGTIRPDRVNLNAPTPDPDAPRAPEWLPRRAVEIFAALATRLDLQQLASKSHTEMLALAAMRLHEVEKFTEVLEREGYTYATKTTTTKKGGKGKPKQETKTMMRARPEIALRSEAARHAQSLLAEFGLSPATLGKVSRQPNPDGMGTNPFSKLG